MLGSLAGGGRAQPSSRGAAQLQRTSTSGWKEEVPVHAFRVPGRGGGPSVRQRVVAAS